MTSATTSATSSTAASTTIPITISMATGSVQNVERFPGKRLQKFPRRRVLARYRPTVMESTSNPTSKSSSNPITSLSHRELSSPRCTSSQCESLPITEPPWHELTMVLDQIVNGENIITFPKYQGSSPLHKHLFELAVTSLENYLEQPDQSLLKDAQVAMSCTFNTMSTRACERFNKEDSTILQQVKASCYMESITIHPCTEIIQRYAQVIQEKDVAYLVRRLKTDQGVLNAQYLEAETLHDNAKVEDKTLSCLNHLCENVLNPPFGSETPSEQDWVNIWVRLLHIIKEDATFHTGEKILESSKSLREFQVKSLETLRLLSAELIV
ncbi:hypothetical protein BGX27_002532 [Mortierella sp. AM989]|nr:hypothetical protein BGX27_002532 [Mortierella sp. AM989]